MKIIHKLILGFLAVSLLICVTGYLAVNASKKIMQDVFTDNVGNMAFRVMNEIDRDMHNKIELFQDYINEPDLQETVLRSNQYFDKLEDIQTFINSKDEEWVSAGKDEVTPFMQDLINNDLSDELQRKIGFYEQKYGYRVFGEVFVTNKYGANVAQTGKTSDYRQDDEKWWQKAKENGLYVTDVEYDDSSHVYSTDIALRIDNDDGNFMGVIKVVMNIEEILHIIKSIEANGIHKQHKHMIYRLLTADGKILYSTLEGEKFFENVSDPFIPETEDEHMAKLIDGENGKALRIHSHSKGFGDFKGLNWVLLIEHSAEELFAPVTRLKNRILYFSLIVTAFAISLGLFISRSIAKPISILRDSTTKIGNGDLDTRIEVRSKDEVGQLAHSFRKMTANLKKTTTSIHKLNKEIDERKRVENDLNLSYGFSRTILDSMNDAISIVDVLDFSIVDCNRAFLYETGLTKDEVIGQYCYKITHHRSDPCKPPDDMCPLTDALITGRYTSFEHVHYGKNGEKIYVEVSASPIKDEKGNVVSVVHVSRNVTDRRKAENMLEKLYDQNKLLLNAAGEGIYGLDTEGKTTLVNPAAAQMIGWEPEELIGKNQHDILHHTRPDGSPYPREDCPIYAAFKDGNVHRVEEEIFWRRDGSSFPVEYISSPIRDKNNNLTGAVVTFKDISERKEMEGKLIRQAQELSHSNTELQRIVQIASHDLQEPLRMVITYVQLLAKKYKGRLDKDADDFIGFAEDGAKKMRVLVKGLLTYSRIGTHGKPFEVTDCEAVLQEALSSLHKNVEDSKAEITHDPLPKVVADAGQLAQLFQNLISNAIKFNDKEPPRVHISTVKDGDNPVFSVKDNGIGIEEKNQERVFQIFQRFQSQSEYAGTEIGLAVCRRIVERHRGRVWVESELGKGTTFYFTIPKGSGKINKHVKPASHKTERIEDYETYEM